MTDREKLIGLIEKWNKDEFCLSYASYELADYFIANGVVIQEQGEWIRQDETYTRFQCSRCLSENHHGYGNYCPNCGAKMKEVK